LDGCRVRRTERAPKGRGVPAQADPIADFMDGLDERGHEPLLMNISGTVRFDLVSGKSTERWLVAIRKGTLAVSRRNAAADTVIRLSKTLGEALVAGETNIFTAMLRGEVELEGDYRLMIMVRRLLRRRLAVGQPEKAAGYTRRQK
jgi:SCP-2 sterol transfer family protein